MSVDDLSLCLGVLWVLWCCMLSSSKRPVTDHKLENNLLFHSFQAKMRCFPLFYFIPEYTQKNVELIFEILNPREPLSSKQYLLYLFRFRPSRNLGGPATLPLWWLLWCYFSGLLSQNPGRWCVETLYLALHSFSFLCLLFPVFVLGLCILGKVTYTLLVQCPWCPLPCCYNMILQDLTHIFCFISIPHVSSSLSVCPGSRSLSANGFDFMIFISSSLASIIIFIH